MANQQVHDASFFELVHNYVRDMTPATPEGAERRIRQRRSYPTVQMVAPYQEGRLPSREMFRQVACYDLSTGGMAYYAKTPPATDRIVVALASQAETLYLTAAVCHSRPVEPSGSSRFLVGCRFLGRVYL